MFDWLFGNKKEVERVKEETKKSFDSVKNDISDISRWIKHLDSEKNYQKREVEDIKDVLSSVKKDVGELKNVVMLMGGLKMDGKLRLSKQLTKRRAADQADQTADQTPNFDQFSTTEKAILWVLVNTDMKLSYDDIGAMMNKERSTVRNQINNIRQKNPSMINEIIEKNGKKRVFIPENIKEILLKKSKVRVNNQKRIKKSEKSSEY